MEMGEDCMPCGYGNKPEFINMPKYCMHCKYFGKIDGEDVCKRNFFLENWLLGYPLVSPRGTCEYFQYHEKIKRR